MGGSSPIPYCNCRIPQRVQVENLIGPRVLKFREKPHKVVLNAGWAILVNGSAYATGVMPSRVRRNRNEPITERQQNGNGRHSTWDRVRVESAKLCLARKISQDLCLIRAVSGEEPKPSGCMFKSPVHKTTGAHTGVVRFRRRSMSSLRLSSSRTHSASLSEPSGGKAKVAQWRTCPPSSRMSVHILRSPPTSSRMAECCVSQGILSTTVLA